MHDAGGDGQRVAAGGVAAEDDLVGVNVLAELEHGGAAEARGDGQAGGFEGVQALLAGQQVIAAPVEAVDGDFGQTFAEPFEAGFLAGILEGKRQNNLGACRGRGAHGCGRRLHLCRRQACAGRREENRQGCEGRTATPHKGIVAGVAEKIGG